MKVLCLAAFALVLPTLGQAAPPDRDLLYPTYPPQRVYGTRPPTEFRAIPSNAITVSPDRMVAEVDELIQAGERSLNAKDLTRARDSLSLAKKKLLALIAQMPGWNKAQIDTRSSAVDALLMKAH